MANRGGPAPRVLIGFAESLPAPEVAWSLLDEGFRVMAFSRTGRPLLRRCPDVDIVRIASPTDDPHAACLDLERLAIENGAAVLMPVDDESLWMCGMISFARDSIVAPDPNGARLALDKRLQIQRAVEAGFGVPEAQTGSARELRDARRIPFPLIIRRALAVEERDGRLVRAAPVVCANEAELEAALDRLGDSPLIAQPLLYGVSEGLFGLATAGGVRAWSAHRRVRQTNPQGSASSACVSTAVPSDVVEPAERFIRASGWNGLFMLELLRDGGGVPWFVEFNGRAWGSMALARRIGFEFPAWAAQAALDPEVAIEPPAIREGVLCRNLGLDLLHTALVFRGPRSTALHWPSRWRTLRDVLTFRRSDTWYNLRRGRRMLFVEDTVATTSHAFVRLLKR